MNAFRKTSIAATLLVATTPMLAIGGIVDPLTVISNSQTRTYALYVPSACPAGSTNSCPLVIVLHGGGEDYRTTYSNIAPSSVWSVTPPQAGGQSVAEQYGVLIAMPNGTDDTSSTGLFSGYSTGHSWNDCTGFFPGYPSSINAFGAVTAPTYPVDDVAFIRAMVADIEKTYTVNPQKIYATGVSNGANMALRLARDAPDLIAAVAAEAAGEGAVPVLPSGTPTSINYNSASSPASNLPYNKIWPQITSSNGNQYTNYTLAPSWPPAQPPPAPQPPQCQYPQVNSSGQFLTNQQQLSNAVPVLLLKGQSDLYAAYGGGTSVDGSGAWWLPYDPGFVNASTANTIAGFPQAFYENMYSSTVSADPWSTASGDNNEPTSPTGITLLSMMWSRYGLGSNPSPTSSLVYNTKALDPDIYDGSGNDSKLGGVDSIMTCNDYVNSAYSRAEIDSCIISNHGHDTPSIAVQMTKTPNLPSGTGLFGSQNHDVEAAEMEWAFFANKTHP